MRPQFFYSAGLTLLLTIPQAGFAKSYEALRGDSKLTYHLHHPFHEIESVSRDFSCTVDLSDDTTHAKIHVKASVVSFNSGNSSRDSHALEVLDAFKYPAVEFTSDSVRHEEKSYRVFGRLTFHGVTRPINFAVVPEYGKDKVRIKGGFTLKLGDYKVERPSLMMIRTDEDLKIDIDVVAVGP